MKRLVVAVVCLLSNLPVQADTPGFAVDPVIGPQQSSQSDTIPILRKHRGGILGRIFARPVIQPGVQQQIADLRDEVGWAEAASLSNAIQLSTLHR